MFFGIILQDAVIGGESSGLFNEEAPSYCFIDVDLVDSVSARSSIAGSQSGSMSVHLAVKAGALERDLKMECTTLQASREGI